MAQHLGNEGVDQMEQDQKAKSGGRKEDSPPPPKGAALLGGMTLLE